MKVVVLGASGETGRSIVSGLLESPDKFEITAVSRPSSLESKNNQTLKKLGVNLVGLDLDGPQDEWVRLFTGIDVVISAVNAAVLRAQIPIADAAKKAGVGRFIPCCFATACPPRGVMQVREIKEDVLDHIKKIYLPYTVIDVGWWYQISAPRLPSGRVDYAVAFPSDHIAGDGTAPVARTHLQDVGRYVARIIADPRTLNKMVFAYSEVISQGQVVDMLEKASGEHLDRNYISELELNSQVHSSQEALRLGDVSAIQGLWVAQYQLSWGIRGDNSPEHAKYLGYLDCKELYPDMTYITFEEYVKELLNGKAIRVYA